MECIYFLFIAKYHQIRDEQKNGRKSSHDVKEEHFKPLINGEIEFKFRWHQKLGGNNCVQKGTFKLTYKQGLLFEKFKQPSKFSASKSHKSVRKVSKTRNDLELF